MELYAKKQTKKGEKKKNRRENLWDLGLGKKFLDLTPKAWSTQGKIDKFDLIKIKHLCTMDDCEKDEKTSYKWEKIFTKHIPDNELVSKISKYIKNS